MIKKKLGRGRPKKSSDEPKSSSISFQLNEDTKNILIQESDQQGVSLSSHLRNILTEYVSEKHGGIRKEKSSSRLYEPLVTDANRQSIITDLADCLATLIAVETKRNLTNLNGKLNDIQKHVVFM